MDGLSHRVLGAATYAVALPVLPIHGTAAIVFTGLLAVASSSGRLLSPDADQGWLWHLIDRWVPDEKLLGDNGPMQHRGITHFWLWTVLALATAYLVPTTITIGINAHMASFSAAPVLAGFGVGWGSHLLGDFLVGAAGQGRTAGIPLGPWHCWIGTGAKCGGFTEWAVTGLAFPLAAYLIGAELGLYNVIGTEHLTALVGR